MATRKLAGVNDVTFSWPQQNRGPGHVVSPSRVVPAGAVGKTVALSGVLSAADLNDTSLSLTMGFEWSQDGGTTWDVLISGNWTGGHANPKNGVVSPPSMSISIDSADASFLVGTTVRAFADLPRVVNLGADIAITG